MGLGHQGQRPDARLVGVDAGRDHDLVGVGPADGAGPFPRARCRGSRSGASHMVSSTSADSAGEKRNAAASSGEGNSPRRPVRRCTMLSADEPASHRASASLGAQTTETATIALGVARAATTGGTATDRRRAPRRAGPG